MRQIGAVFLRGRIAANVMIRSTAVTVAIWILSGAVVQSATASDLISPGYRLRGGHINSGAFTGASSTEASPQVGSVGATMGQLSVANWVVDGLHRGTAGFWDAVTETQTDQDGDSIIDEFDNCTLDFNLLQRDTDGDGCGNICDGDYDQDGISSGSDFLIFRGAFQAETPGNPGFNEDADSDGDGFVGGMDFLAFRRQFTDVYPGPSVRTDRDPIACP